MHTTHTIHKTLNGVNMIYSFCDSDAAGDCIPPNGDFNEGRLFMMAPSNIFVYRRHYALDNKDYVF